MKVTNLPWLYAKYNTKEFILNIVDILPPPNPTWTQDVWEVSILGNIHYMAAPQNTKFYEAAGKIEVSTSIKVRLADNGRFSSSSAPFRLEYISHVKAEVKPDVVVTITDDDDDKPRITNLHEVKTGTKDISFDACANKRFYGLYVLPEKGRESYLILMDESGTAQLISYDQSTVTVTAPYEPFTAVVTIKQTKRKKSVKVISTDSTTVADESEIIEAMKKSLGVSILYNNFLRKKRHQSDTEPAQLPVVEPAVDDVPDFDSTKQVVDCSPTISIGNYTFNNPDFKCRLLEITDDIIVGYVRNANNDVVSTQWLLTGECEFHYAYDLTLYKPLQTYTVLATKSITESTTVEAASEAEALALADSAYTDYTWDHVDGTDSVGNFEISN